METDHASEFLPQIIMKEGMQLIRIFHFVHQGSTLHEKMNFLESIQVALVEGAECSETDL